MKQPIDLDQFGQGRNSILRELKRYNLKEMQKLQKAIDATPEDKTNLKQFAKRQLLKGHIRQLGIIETLLDVKLKNLKRL
jgi:hypothetical protein